MIKNYLKTALRLMLRQKAYSAINIIGLSLGIAASLMILLYIADELSFDRFQKDAKNMYRIVFTGRMAGNSLALALSPAPVGNGMMTEIPETESMVRFGIWRTMPMRFGEKAFTENNMAIADSNFFEFFSFPLITGDAKTVLKGVNKVVISETAAKKYFGSDNPIGKVLLRGSDQKVSEVTGVFKDVPSNSHIQFDMVLSGESWEYLQKNSDWVSNNLYTYIKLHPAATATAVQKKVADMAERHMGAELEKVIGVTMQQFRKQGNDVGLIMQPMLNIHLNSNFNGEIVPNGNKQYLYIFGAIAIFIVLIACINFMNLSTARSANRAKEVGVRKTIGAVRTKLIGQFISESMIYSFISTILAILIIAAMMTLFNNLSGKSLSVATLASPAVILGIIGFAIFVGLIAGSYPAFYLTAFNPVDVLKGKVRSGFKNSGLRNGLVVFQFIISISLILGSLVVYKQLKYMQEKNLGFEKENVVRLIHTWSLNERARGFKTELASHPDFVASSFANDLPGHISNENAYRKEGTEQDFVLRTTYVDHDHLETMKYKMVTGRFFSRDFRSDTAAVIINEAAFRQMGYKNIDNEFIHDYSNDANNKPRSMRIIGVIKDFNYESLRSDVAPLAMLLGNEPNGAMAIRLAKGNVQEQIKLLENIWRKYSTDAFQYTFVDDDFDLLFRSEQRISGLILIFTILTIAIACLGLFGLATFVGEQRAKEISIRKVMGASIGQMMGLLFKDFTILILVAFVIAAPLGWYLMNKWLEGFAYRVNIDASIIAIAGLSSLTIAVLTISYQSVKAAKTNPVIALRGE